MKKIDRRIAANSGEIIHTVGRYIWLKSATGAVSIKTDRGETALLTEGDFIRTDDVFTEFFVTDESGAQNDVTFNISEKGEAGLYKSTFALAVSNTIVDTPDKTLTAATPTILAAANSNRRELILTADSANTNTTRIGSNAVAANRGIPLVPGATLILETNAAIYGFNAAAEVVAVNELEST